MGTIMMTSAWIDLIAWIFSFLQCNETEKPVVSNISKSLSSKRMITTIITNKSKDGE